MPDDRTQRDIARPSEPEILPPPRYRGRQDDTWIGSMLVMAGLLGAFLLVVFAITWWSARPPAVPIEPVAIHYAPAENLETYDVALIDRARRTIDMAAYVLTDQPVLEALERAARRGVTVRILVDRGQLEDRPEPAPLMALQGLPGVTLRVKRGNVLMHLKSYAVDAHWLRTGAGNLSASGLKQQDNDSVFFDSPSITAGFERNFERVFAAGATE